MEPKTFDCLPCEFHRRQWHTIGEREQSSRKIRQAGLRFVRSAASSMKDLVNVIAWIVITRICVNGARRIR